MRISLELLAEKLELSEDSFRIRSFGGKYSRLWFDADHAEIPENAILVTENLPSPDRIKAGTAYLFVNMTQDIPEQMPCEYIQLYEETDVRIIFNRVSGVFSMLSEQLESLYQRSAENASLQELINDSYKLFDNPLYLVDSSFKVIAIDRRKNMRELSATWKRLEDDGYMPLDLVENLIQSHELDAMETGKTINIIYSQYFYTPFINCNLRYKGSLQGHLFIIGMFRPISRGDLEIAEEVSRIILHTMLRSEQFQHQRGRLYQHFMKDLLNGKHFEKGYFQKQVQYLNLPENCRFLLGRFRAQNSSETIYERLASQLERSIPVRLIQEPDSLTGLFLLKPGESSEHLISRLERTLRSFRCIGGFSDVFSVLTDAPIHVRQTLRALTRGLSSSCTQTCFSYPDLAIYDLLEISRDDQEILCAPEIREMLEYDLSHDTPYAETLRQYLLHERNILDTAAALNIHRNTLTYRIEKILKLFPLNLENPSFRYRYLYSLFLMDDRPVIH